MYQPQRVFSFHSCTGLPAFYFTASTLFLPMDKNYPRGTWPSGIHVLHHNIWCIQWWIWHCFGPHSASSKRGVDFGCASPTFQLRSGFQSEFISTVFNIWFLHILYERVIQKPKNKKSSLNVFRTCSNMFWGDLTYWYSTKTFWLKWDFLFSVAFLFFSIHGIHKLSSVFAFSHDSIFISFAPLFHGFHVHVNIFCLHHICGPVGAHASHPNLASPWRKPSHWPGHFRKLGTAIHHPFGVAINNFGIPLSGRFFESVSAGIWPNLCRILHCDSSISYCGDSKPCVRTWIVISYWGLWLNLQWETQDHKFIFRMSQRSLDHSIMEDPGKLSLR